jgi:chromosome segregation ATPase
MFGGGVMRCNDRKDVQDEMRKLVNPERVGEDVVRLRKDYARAFDTLIEADRVIGELEDELKPLRQEVEALRRELAQARRGV